MSPLSLGDVLDGVIGGESRAWSAAVIDAYAERREFWPLDRAPVDSATGIRRLMDYARLYGLVLDAAHLRIAAKYRADTTGVMFLEPIPTGNSWVKDLFFSTKVIRESPPCEAWTGAPWPERWNFDNADPITDIKRLFGEAPRCKSCGVNVELMGCFCDTEANRIEFGGEISGTGRLTADEFDRFINMDVEPEPTGKRYGPYDADPHTKGRRRRFRTQRKA